MLFIKNVLAANIASDEDLQGVISGFSIENLYKVFDAASLWVLVFGVVLGVIAFSFAGIQFLTSRGDATKLSTAKTTATYAAIGTVFIVVSRAIIVIIGKFFS